MYINSIRGNRMHIRYLKQLPLAIASLGLYAAASDRKTELENYSPSDCAELCWRSNGLECDEQWDFNAGAIYFQAKAQGVDIAVITQDRNNNTFPVNGVGVQPDESLWWGFKVGGGYKLFRQDWRITVDYTFFNSVTNVPLQTAYGTAFIPSIYNNQFIGDGLPQNFSLFNSLDIGVRNTINNVQICASRPTYIDRNIEISPYYGLDISFLTRRSVTRFTNDINPNALNASVQRYQQAAGGFYQTYQKWSWWGVGPCVGLHTNWFMKYDFSLYGDLYGALNYGSSRCRVSNFSRPANLVASNFPNFGFIYPQEAVIDNILYQFAPEFTYQLGLNWSKMTDDKSMLVQLNIGYESSYFFNVIKTITPDLAYRIEDGSGLGLQGLVLQAFIDY